MFDLMTIPPTLPPLLACVIALGCLWIGAHSLRTKSASPLFGPMVQLNLMLMEMAERDEAARQKKAPRLAAESIRVYGWAFVYAGVFGLIIAGGQLLRLLSAC